MLKNKLQRDTAQPIVLNSTANPSLVDMYPALKTNYTSHVIPGRKDAFMIWDIPKKQTTVDGDSVFDDKSRANNQNQKNICKNEIKYTDYVSVYDCKTFYVILSVGGPPDTNGWASPPNPELYGPFDK